MEKRISNKIIGYSKLIQEILLTFKENPKEFYTPRIMYESIQKGDTRFCSNALWRLWKLGFLTHTNRRYYKWNPDK